MIVTARVVRMCFTFNTFPVSMPGFKSAIMMEKLKFHLLSGNVIKLCNCGVSLMTKQAQKSPNRRKQAQKRPDLIGWRAENFKNLADLGGRIYITVGRFDLRGSSVSSQPA